MTVITKVIEIARAEYANAEAEARAVLHALAGFFQSPEEHPDLQPFAEKALGNVPDLIAAAAETIDGGATFGSHHVSSDGVQVAIEASAPSGNRTSGDTSVYRISLSDVTAQTPAPDDMPDAPNAALGAAKTGEPVETAAKQNYVG